MRGTKMTNSDVRFDFRVEGWRWCRLNSNSPYVCARVRLRVYEVWFDPPPPTPPPPPTATNSV